MEILVRRFKNVVGKIPAFKIGYFLPHSLRLALIAALRTHHERILVTQRAVVHKWNDLGVDVDTRELFENPARWGKPEIVRGGLNGVVNEGETYLIYGMTALGSPTSTNQYTSANARLGVGDNNTAESEAHTDLQAATNKLRKVMVTPYPTLGTRTVDFRSTFGTSEANWNWLEWALFNAATGGSMFSRKQEGLGSKSTGSTWTLTATMDFDSV
jgi:hypothetical protein